MNNSIRKKTIEIIRQYGVEIDIPLPHIEDISYRKDMVGIVNRMHVLHVLAGCGHGYKKNKAIKWLSDNSLIDHISKQERDSIYSNSSMSIYINYAHALWAMSWAAGMRYESKLLNMPSSNLYSQFPDLRRDEKVKINKVSMVNIEELYSALDILYCSHWVARELEINKKVCPFEIDINAIRARRQSLEWMVSEDDWDDVDLST